MKQTRHKHELNLYLKRSWHQDAQIQEGFH